MIFQCLSSCIPPRPIATGTLVIPANLDVIRVKPKWSTQDMKRLLTLQLRSPIAVGYPVYHGELAHVWYIEPWEFGYEDDVRGEEERPNPQQDSS